MVIDDLERTCHLIWAVGQRDETSRCHEQLRVDRAGQALLRVRANGVSLSCLGPVMRRARDIDVQNTSRYMDRPQSGSGG